MQTDDTNHIYENYLDKACFQHDMAYGRYKNGTEITQLAFETASNPKYDGYQKALASIVFKFFDNKSIEVLKGILVGKPI